MNLNLNALVQLQLFLCDSNPLFSMISYFTMRAPQTNCLDLTKIAFCAAFMAINQQKLSLQKKKLTKHHQLAEAYSGGFCATLAHTFFDIIDYLPERGKGCVYLRI